ncbi:MAG: efflux RND transporter periplasmic adaptor subunit [Zoogloea sp.]|uniref:efflux RND transporter periplasmic adaptor subunit n=1 Tax=Zoogloea sp. TaxID=49181 RepID=UPI003F2A2A74
MRRTTRSAGKQWTMVMGALAVALLAACSHPEPVAEQARPVVVFKVGQGAANGASQYTGEVRARHETDLAFRVGGKVVERLVDVGAAVKAGQVLARLDPSDTGLNAEAAKAQLAAAQSDFVFARAEVERYRDLLARNFVSRSVLDAKESAFRAAQARVEQAQAQASVAGNQAGYTRLVADRAGVITAVLTEVGQVVKDAAPVMKLAQDGEREVAIAVPENRLARLRDAQSLQIRLWARPELTLTGKVREVAPSADPTTRTYAVRVTIQNPGPDVNLGMTASVSLAEGGDAGLLVPSTAVFEHQGGSAVWVLQPEGELVKPVLRPVKVRQYREDGAVLSEGLKAGETIALAGVHKIVAGQPLRPRQPASPGVVPVAVKAEG